MLKEGSGSTLYSTTLNSRTMLIGGTRIMYYIRHYSIDPMDTELKRILDEQYHISCSVFLDRVMIFDVPENHPQIEELDKILPLSTPDELLQELLRSKKYDNPTVSISYHPQYLEEECLTAKWLSVRSIFDKVDPVNCETINTCQCYVCTNKWGIPMGRHTIQAEPYVIKKDIKWRRHCFASPTINMFRLFCNDTAKTVLTAEGMTGIQFESVFKKSTGLPAEDIYQLKAVYTIANGGIVPLANMEMFVCEQCRMKMLYSHMRGRYGIIPGSVSDAVDFYETLPMFLGPVAGEELSATSQYIISQRMHQVLQKNKMDRGLVFVPLDEVHEE